MKDDRKRAKEGCNVRRLETREGAMEPLPFPAIDCRPLLGTYDYGRTARLGKEGKG